MSMQTIAVTLPDGAVREVPSGTTPLEIANSISPRLAAICVVARLTPVTGTAAKADSGEEASAEAAMYSAEDAAGAPAGGLDHPAHRGHAPGTGYGKGSRGADGGAPLSRARAGRGGA